MKVREAAEYPILKIKLGTARDREIMEAIRAETDRELRVDANCGWTVKQTIAMLPVLREFGVQIGDDVEVRVWDSTAELRYLVLPERPPGTDGMSEDELATLVTRDAMIGVARVRA